MNRDSGVTIDLETGLVQPAVHRPSPNQDARPADCAIDLVVLHGISLPPGAFGGPWVDRLFTNRLDPAAHPYFREIAHLRVSSHLFVGREGHIVQYVPLHRRAWHAGRSSHQGRPDCNDFSIGIEMEGTDESAYTEAQYRTLDRLLPALMAVYPGIAADRIVGHCDVSPGRKTDPGPCFDWERARRAVLSNRDHGREMTGDKAG